MSHARYVQWPQGPRSDRRQAVFHLLPVGILRTFGIVLFSLGMLPSNIYASYSFKEPIVITQLPAVSAHPLSPEAFNRARIVVWDTNQQARVLSHGLTAACDPDVSFDGKRVVFAGKKQHEDHWSIWEIKADGTELRQIVSRPRDCRTPIYVGSLFTLNSPEPWYTLVFTATEPFLTETGAGRATSLYSVKTDGTEPRRLTFNPGLNLDPFAMWDGRVLYAGTRRGRTATRTSLFGVHIDGMEHELYGAEQRQPYQIQPCGLRNGLVVFVENASGQSEGQLACVREASPRNSHRILTEEEGMVWSFPSPLSQSAVLVSRRRKAAGGTWGICALDTETGTVTEICDSTGYHELQARVLLPRPAPDGRSTVVEPQHETGKLYGLNCYLTDDVMRPHLRPGAIHRLRVIEGVPASDSLSNAKLLNGSTVGRRLLGEAPVEPDGSFHVEIPADIPVQLQALDTNGLALATCDWLWVKQKENRGCIGCHEDPELMPENHFVKALARKANALTLAVEQRRTVTFRQDISPLLAASCAAAECHNGSGSRLQFSANATTGSRRAYETLLACDEQGQALYVEPGQARTSKLYWHLAGWNTSRPWDKRDAREPVRQMPPAEKHHALAPDQLRLFREWIDLGAQWDVGQKSNQNLTIVQEP